MRRLCLLPVLVVLSACGETTIDAEEVEKHLKENALHPDRIASVECPEDREAEKGDTFDCTVRGPDGSEEVARVEQVDDEGTIRVVANRQTKLGRRTTEILPQNVEQLIRASAVVKRPNRSVACPPGVKIEEDATFDCSALAVDGTREIVEVRQVDDLGNIRIAGVRPTRR